MKRNLIKICFYGIGCSLLYAASVNAQGIPSFDIANVMNTIETGSSQIESQVSTTMETVSTANIQQSIGDKFGGLSKLKDMKEKADKEKEKLEKQKKRAEKLEKMRADAENTVQKGKDAYDKGKDAYDKGNSYYEQGKDAYAQGQDYYNQGQGMVGQGQEMLNQSSEMANGLKAQVNDGVNVGKNTFNETSSGLTSNFSNATDNFSAPSFKNNGSNTPAVSAGGNAGREQVRQEPALKGSLNKGFGIAKENAVADNPRFNRAADLNVQDGFEDEGLTDDLFDVSNEAMPIETVSVKKDVEFVTGDDASINIWDDMEDVIDEETIINPKQFNRVETENMRLPDRERIGINKDMPASKTGVVTSGGVKADKTTDVKEKVNTAPLNIKEDSKGRTAVKAFGRVSYVLDFKEAFASQTKTGTDKDGNFYFPDAFANWADINYDETADSEKLFVAIQKICGDLQSTLNTETREFDEKYDNEIIGKMRANAMAHSVVGAKEAESGKAVEDLENMTEKATDTALTQMSALGEINAKQIRQNRLDIVRLSDEVMAMVFDEIRRYCFDYALPEDGEE